MAEGAALLPARRTEHGIVIAVRLTPKSSDDAVTGVEITAEGAVLKLKLRALPEKGRANQAAIALLARWLDQPKTSIELLTGGKSRLKQFSVRGDAETLIGKLASRIDAL